MPEGRRTTLANALHYSGRLEEAEKWFREAEAIQEKWKSDYYYIYSVWGFRFCDLLLNQGMYHEVIKQAEKTLEWGKKGGILLDIALDNLSLGHAWMKLEQKNGNNDFKYAMEFLNRAVSGLQEASRNDYLPRALFVRAECYRRQKQFSKVWDDLNEALEIADSGSMKLYIADYHLEAGKLCAAQGKQPDARKHFTPAKEMMEEMGYLRKLQEVTELLGSCS
jgi:tetratricopeptide (TPR) repeat protein